MAVIRLNAATCAAMLPERDPDSHKGTHGTVVCVAGSLDYAGAGLLCAMAAARGGAGLVALAVPRSLQPLFAGRVPEIVTLGLAESADGDDIDPGPALDQVLARQPDALVLGPGLRETSGYTALAAGLVGRAAGGTPAVVDGGALNLLAPKGEMWAQFPWRCVLTPHPAEFARLTGEAVGPGEDERLKRCFEAAARFGQVVVLKGARTVIAAPDGRVAMAPFANAALATAGSGDVLAGLIGSLVAQRVPLYEAACLGVFLHGRAGERISERLGDAGLLASELPYEAAIARRELTEMRFD